MSGLCSLKRSVKLPGREVDRLPSDPMYLDDNVLEQPFAAMHLAAKELERLGEMVLNMIKNVQQAFIDGDGAKSKAVFAEEEAVNKLQESIVNYLASMYSKDTITEEQGERVSKLLHVAGDIEHVGDQCKNIAEFADDKRKLSYEFSNEAYSEIYGCFDLAKKMMTESITIIENEDVEAANRIRAYENEMNSKEDFLRRQHMHRINEGKCSPEFTVIYTDVIHNIEKIGDYCNNIADTVLGEEK